MIPSFSPSHERDAGDFVVCIDGFDKESIRKLYVDHITAIISSIVLATNSIVSVESVRSGTVFFREDEKPVYSFSFEVGGAGFYRSIQVGEQLIQDTQKVYVSTVLNHSMTRVQQMLKSSLENNRDPLRAFLFAWFSFEIFVNKAFDECFNRRFELLFGGSYESSDLISLDQVLDRAKADSLIVQKVPTCFKENTLIGFEEFRSRIKNKYRFIEKFRAIGLQLSPNSFEQDFVELKKIKKARDEFSHGNEVDEKILPIESTRNFVAKYLRLYLLESISRNEGMGTNK